MADGVLRQRPTPALDVAGDRGSGDAGGIVVRLDQSIGVLDQIDAQEERVTLGQVVPDLAQERRPTNRLEVADRRAEERDQPFRAARQVPELVLDGPPIPNLAR